ncbi:LacI family DNA-binding transcriptional regulator [Thioclava kandeliae]|uniref:LacI family DNA-binding transcriptional regulator n=1 Tax=Thioclava kandeliae TaxID=3070818 RepID=A0ABV1SL18_9RHOB
MTIADVAKLAGVSNGTVSRFNHEPERVSPATRDKIQAAIETLGYSPNILARNFRTGSTGVILVLTSGIGDPFYGDVISGIGRVARSKGYTVRIEELYDGTPLSSNDLSSFISSRQADGIVVLGSPWPFRHSERDAGDASYAIVVCGETSDPELARYPRFQIDGRSAAHEMTRYLIGQGHYQIGFLGVAGATVPLVERENGYKLAMKEANIELSPDWIADAGVTIEEARRATTALLHTQKKPTAIICATDDIALAAMAEIHAQGLVVPRDICVTGFDDTRYAAIANPPLTTVAQPREQIGENAVYKLIDMMNNKPAPLREEQRQYILPHRIILRGSSQVLAGKT